MCNSLNIMYIFLNTIHILFNTIFMLLKSLYDEIMPVIQAHTYVFEWVLHVTCWVTRTLTIDHAHHLVLAVHSPHHGPHVDNPLWAAMLCTGISVLCCVWILQLACYDKDWQCVMRNDQMHCIAHNGSRPQNVPRIKSIVYLGLQLYTFEFQAKLITCLLWEPPVLLDKCQTLRIWACCVHPWIHRGLKKHDHRSCKYVLRTYSLRDGECSMTLPSFFTSYWMICYCHAPTNPRMLRARRNVRNSHKGVALTHSVDEDASGLTFEEWNLTENVDSSQMPVAMIINSSKLRAAGFTPWKVFPPELEAVVVCVCVRMYTSTHPPTILTPANIEKYIRQNPYRYPCQNITSDASTKC